MKLVIIAALLASCRAAKLDRTYLPPPSATNAGGNPDSLQTPFSKSTTGQIESSGSLPAGSYTNDFEAVVVDAAAAGTRASSDGEQSGLGGPRESYGSENSKVGEAAFRGPVAGFRGTPTLGSSGSNGQIAGGQNFGSFESKSERPQAFRDRNSNIISYANDVSLNNYNYGFESDNGIAVGENGVANNGIQAQGGYSYKGDDGQVYKVTYVADEGGYRPQGDHLPTPPPIPQEILESLEQNAKDEAAGIVNDGSYDAQKYNAEGDYTHHNGDNTQYNGAQLSQFAKQPESDATASNTFINQNSQAFGKPGQLDNIGVQSTHTNLNGQSNEYGTSYVNNHNNNAEFQDKQSIHIMKEHRQNAPTGLDNSGYFGQHSGGQPTSQFDQTLGNQFVGNQNNHFGSQHDQQAPAFGTQSTQFGFQTNQHGSGTPSGSQTNQVGPASQIQAQPDKSSLEQNSNSAFTSHSNQGTQIGNQASLPNDSFRPFVQTQNGFKQPSQYNDNKEKFQTSQTPFANAGATKPLFNKIDPKDPSAIGQSQVVSNNGNRFPSSPNQFGAEYLSPSNSNGRPANNKPHLNDVLAPQKSNRDNQTPGAIPSITQNQNLPQSSSASAFASVGSTEFDTQPVKPFNTFQTQTFGPNQFNYNKNNNNNQLTSHAQTESNALPTFSHHSGSHTVSEVVFGAKPTSIPDAELTTPLESFKNPDLYQGSQFNSQSAPSMENFGSQLSNHQSQPQIGFQSNVDTSQHPMSQTLVSNFSDSRPQGTTQLGFLPPTPATQVPSFNQQQPQFPQNVISQNQQNLPYFSTQKPSFSQTFENSYYYNQPSKPFATPSITSQGTRFPSLPSFQSNSIATSQSNRFPNQQGTQTSSSNIPISPLVTSAAPTPSSQFTQTHGPVSNYYNGITQASISSFPSVPSTASSQFGSNQGDQFGSKPSSILPSISPQSNRPIFSQQNSDVATFPQSYVTTIGQKTPSSFSQNQTGQSSLYNNNFQAAAPFSHTKPITPSHSFTHYQTTNKDQPTTQGQRVTSNQTEQYQGTIYEYNKPEEFLPAPEQTDSSSSQSVQTDQNLNNQASKPQFESPQTQFGQSTFSSQSQQYSFSQGSKPQHSSQSYKPFGGSSSNSQFGQNIQSAFPQNIQGTHSSVQTVKPNEPTSIASPQFGTNFGSESKPQIGSDKTFGTSPSLLAFGQNQQPQGTSHTSGFTATYQTKESQNGVQPLKPFGGALSTATQFSHKMQPSLGSTSATQNTEFQFATQSNKPLGSSLNLSQFGQAAQNQASATGFTSTNNNVPDSQISAQPIGTGHGLQRYPLSKPQFGSHLTQTQFTQNSQQTSGATQISSQPIQKPQGKPFGNAGSIHDSPELHKPQFGQNIQLNQGTQAPGQSFDQQSFQSSQFTSSATKPQFSAQTPIGQNQNGFPVKPFGNTSGQTQLVQNSAQASSSAVTQEQPQSVQAYKPFGVLSNQGFSHLQNKPQTDQSPLPSLSTPSSLSQFGVQPFKPFSSFGAQSQNKPQSPQSKPGGSQQSGPCCQGSKDSSIVPLNVGKPSQAFSQTQGQFTGFQGAQTLNAQSVAGKGEEFGGPRQPPSFDAQTGYHY